MRDRVLERFRSGTWAGALSSTICIQHLANICKMDRDLAEGRAIPSDFPALSFLNGPEAVNLPIIHARYYQHKVNMMNQGDRLKFHELWKMKTILLRTPPTTPQQILSDDAFILYIGVLTGSPLPSPLLSPTITHCPLHTNRVRDVLVLPESETGGEAGGEEDGHTLHGRREGAQHRRDCRLKPCTRCRPRPSRAHPQAEAI